MRARAAITRPRLPCAAWLVAALAGGCWYPKERGETLERHVERLDPVEARVEEVRRRVEALAAAPRPGTGDRAEAVAAELAALRVTVAELARRVDGMERTLAQRAVAPPPATPPAPVPAAPGSAGPPRPLRAAAVPPRKPAPPTRSPAEGAALDGARPAPDTAPRRGDDPLSSARAHEARGELTVAKALYHEIAERLAGEPAAAEASFRLGELAVREGRPRDAIVLFGKVARDHPRSPLAPDALLGTAEALRAAGLEEEAVTVLAELRRRYPGAPAAARAERPAAPDHPRAPAAGRAERR